MSGAEHAATTPVNFSHNSLVAFNRMSRAIEILFRLILFVSAAVPTSQQKVTRVVALKKEHEMQLFAGESVIKTYTVAIGTGGLANSTSASMEPGTPNLLPVSPAATTAQARASIGPLAIAEVVGLPLIFQRREFAVELLRHEGQYSDYSTSHDQQCRINFVLKQDQQSAHGEGSGL